MKLLQAIGLYLIGFDAVLLVDWLIVLLGIVVMRGGGYMEIDDLVWLDGCGGE